jgi:hypothetical protein
MFEEIQRLNHEASKLETKYWLSEDLFSLHWWVIVIVNILFLIVLIKLLDRKRPLQIIIAFLISFILVGFINELGYYYHWWSYPHQFITAFRVMNAVDFLTIPVIHTLLYQKYSGWKPYLIANAIIMAIIAFVGVPLFVHFHFYVLYDWNYLKSYLALFVVGMLVKVIADLLIDWAAVVRKP